MQFEGWFPLTLFHGCYSFGVGDVHKFYLFFCLFIFIFCIGCLEFENQRNFAYRVGKF